MTPELRVGQGIDVHPFADTPRPLVLGGVRINDTDGLEGHSDADVLSHAIADALLGALSMGDLGSRFGVDEPATAGADSLALLAQVVADVEAVGWSVANLDSTILAQRPRLASCRDEIRGSLAGCLGVSTDQLSVKFTTTDHLGAIGRAEGIAAWATVLIARRP